MRKVVAQSPLLLIVVFTITTFCSLHLNAQEKKKSTFPSSRSGQPPVVNASCGDMGAENGWSVWTAKEGYHQYLSANNEYPIFFGSISPASSPVRFAITTGAGVDACTPGGGGPPIPVVCPGFGNSSIRIGEPLTNGIQGNCYSNGPYPAPGVGAAGNGCSEQLSYIFPVGAADTNFIYAFAVIVENPPSGHTDVEAPFAEIYILAPNGDTVTCSHQKYTADLAGGTLPGFYSSNCPPTSAGATVTYKPWTYVGVNLTNYLAQTLTVVITNTDCALGGHACWSYWDFQCPPVGSSAPPYCLGNATTLTGPPSDPNNPYTYTWYQNGTIYTGLPSSSSVSITPTPQLGDTFAVQVHQTSGCDFWIPYIPTPMSVTPNFSYSAVGGCGSGVLNFTDLSTAPNGAPMVAWNWSFPGGTPSTSTVQNPSNISYPPGTYTVTLIVTSQNGCIDTIAIPVTLTGTSPPVAIATTGPVCFNNPTHFTDLSTGSTPITFWNWNFGNGNTSTQQNPSQTYASAGTFSVTLIVTDATGCKDTVSLLAVVNPLPVVNFSLVPVCYHDNTCFTDLSTVSPGTISSWSWNFGDPSSGANNISNIQNPCHVFTGLGPYAVILTVTTDSACQSTISLPATVNPLPVAGISVNSVCLNSNTSFTDASISPAGDQITAWNWNFGDGSANATQQNPMHMYTTAGSYTATLIVTTQKGCKDTAQIPLVVYNPPVANFSAPKDGCSPVVNNYMDLSTSASGSVSSWLWTFSGGSPSSSTSQNPQNILYVAPGSYSVTLIATTNFGCKDTITLPMVQVYPWPGAEFCVAPQQAPATSPVFNFCDLWSSDVTQWSWNFGDGSALDSSNTDPVHSYSATATANDFYSYTICLNVKNQYGCWDSICHTVELLPEYEFYIPNCFTPNQDYTNEFFFGKCRGVKEYNIWVFDRWGNLLWDCHKEDKNTNWDNLGQDGLSSACKWNGKVVQGGFDMSGGSGQLAQEDVYVWKVRLTDIFDKKHMYIGHVSIVK